jgi:hypothetical protein
VIHSRKPTAFELFLCCRHGGLCVGHSRKPTRHYIFFFNNKHKQQIQWATVGNLPGTTKKHKQQIQWATVGNLPGTTFFFNNNKHKQQAQTTNTSARTTHKPPTTLPSCHNFELNNNHIPQSEQESPTHPSPNSSHHQLTFSSSTWSKLPEEEDLVVKPKRKHHLPPTQVLNPLNSHHYQHPNLIVVLGVSTKKLLGKHHMLPDQVIWLQVVLLLLMTLGRPNVITIVWTRKSPLIS